MAQPLPRRTTAFSLAAATYAWPSALTPAQHLGGAKAKGGGVSGPQGGQQGALGLGGVGQVQLEACGAREGKDPMGKGSR